MARQIGEQGKDLEVAAFSSDGSITLIATIEGVDHRAPVSGNQTFSVSHDGFLAVWSEDQEAGNPMVSVATYVFDLRDPAAGPRILGPSKLAEFGPGGALALGTAEGFDIVDPATGATRSIQAGAGCNGEVLDEWGWLADGSGLWVCGATHLLDGSAPTIGGPIPVLQPRGGSAHLPDHVDQARERPFGEGGATLGHGCSDGPQGGACTVFVQGGTIVPNGRWGVAIDGYKVGWDAGGTGLWFVGKSAIGHFDGPTHLDRDLRVGQVAAEPEIVQFAPDDAYVVITTSSAQQFVVDLGADPPVASTIEQAETAWQLAGWGPGFPGYPVTDYRTPGVP